MADLKALIVDDEPDICELVELTLKKMQVDCDSAYDIAAAKAALAKGAYALCITDMRLPDGDGIDLLKHMQQQYPEIPVAMITAHGNMESAINALKAGAFDFVSKPVDLQVLRSLVQTALQLSGKESTSDTTDNKLLGDAPAMVHLREQITKLGRSQAPVHICGGSGTGKELVARMIHESSPRADGAFVPVNCGAIPSELMESEFFGHMKGSFTGASGDKDGLFKVADGGTLFLDEVADLPMAMQVKLLRAIQEKAIRPIGAGKEIKVDVRIVSATHKDLKKLINDERFRQDLYYRINVIELRTPSLCERKEDIPLLVAAILDKFASLHGQSVPTIAPEAMKALRQYEFPGNVRELENILERALTLCENDTINVVDLDLPKQEGDMSIPAQESSAENLDNYLNDMEKQTIMDALEKNRWNKTATAKSLGITFRALRYRLKKLGLE